MPGHSKITISAYLEAETDRAVGVSLDNNGDVDHWLPKSQIEWPETAEKGDRIDVVLPLWLARERGMTDDC